MTAIKTTRKIAYYLRAKKDNKPTNLQALIISARKVKLTAGDSEVKLVDDVVRVQHYKEGTAGVFVHLARYVPGERASTLRPKAESSEDDGGVQTPPEGMEFLDGESFLLVSTHHVLFCGHGIGLSKTTAYLCRLFKEAGLDEKIIAFDLSPATNVDKLKLIQEHGVRAIQLSTSAFQVSLPKEQRKTWIAKALGAVADELSALAEKDDSIAEQRAMEDILINVEVRLDGNTRAVQEAQDFIEQVAETVLDDTEAPISEFAIFTQMNNERIRSSDIRLQSSIVVPQQDKSVSYVKIWEGLENYLHEVEQGNLLEQ